MIAKITMLAGLVLTAALLRAEPPSPFAGTWVGEHQKTVFARLVIADGKPVSGRLVTGRVYTNDDGTLKFVDEAEGDGQPIEHVSVVDGRLVFASDGDHLELSLMDADTAEMRFTDLPPGTKLKPFVLKKK